MEEAEQTMCEKCMTVNYANAEFCRRCGEPLPQNATMPAPQQSYASSYRTSAELPEPPRNALDEFMHLGFGGLIEFGIRFGFVIVIAQILALLVIGIILAILVLVLTILGVSILSLLANYTVVPT